MSLTTARRLPATLLFVSLLSWAQPAYAMPTRQARPHHHAGRRPALSDRDRLALYSPRFRRSTITYLRLRLLELREQDLDRARAAIERRLSIDELLAEPPAGPRLP